MHEFMEYMFQPTYKRLQKSIAAEPTDKAGWKGIKADSLVWPRRAICYCIEAPKKRWQPGMT